MDSCSQIPNHLCTVSKCYNFFFCYDRQFPSKTWSIWLFRLPVEWATWPEGKWSIKTWLLGTVCRCQGLATFTSWVVLPGFGVLLGVTVGLRLFVGNGGSSWHPDVCHVRVFTSQHRRHSSSENHRQCPFQRLVSHGLPLSRGQWEQTSEMDGSGKPG